MKKRYRLVCVSSRGGTFYCHDSLTGKRTSLETTDRVEAERLVEAKNDSLRQPALNINIARAYLAGANSGFATRTWRQALYSLIDTKEGETKARWVRAAKEKALDIIRDKTITETTADHLLSVLKTGTVSTNVHLRKIHNFCLAMGWLPWPIIPKKQWPEIRFVDKRGVTFEEHQKIVGNENNLERKAFYQLCWNLGAAQSDIASLKASDIDWQDRTIGFCRNKTDVPVIISFSDEVADILQALPKENLLFPNFNKIGANHRATEFNRACKRVGVVGVTLHSYRYAWAGRAKVAGFPIRFAQEFLGHRSKAVHQTYAKKAQVKIPSLEEYEKKIVPLNSGILEQRKTA